MRHLTGGHGTSKSRADSIERHGWKIANNRSLAASGLYFWLVGDRNIEFALAWAEKNQASYEREGDSDASPAALLVKVEVAKENLMDFTRPEARFALDELGQKARGIAGGMKSLQKLQDTFLTKMEQHRKRPFFACITGVPAPTKCRGLVYTYDAPVLIVRNISIIKETTRHYDNVS